MSDLLLDSEGDSPLHPGCDEPGDGEGEHHGEVARPASLACPEHWAGVEAGRRGAHSGTHQDGGQPDTVELVMASQTGIVLAC